MAMGVTALAAGLGSTSNAASYTGTAGTPITGETLLAVFHCVTFTGTVTSVTGGGFTWYPVAVYNTNTTTDRVFIYSAYASSGTSTTPTINLSASAAGCSISVFRLTGLEGTVVPYVRQVATNTNTTANPSVTLSVAPLTGNGLIGVAVNLTNSSTQWTAPSGFSSLHQVAFNTPASSLQTSYVLSGVTATTHTWTNASVTRWNCFVFEFYVAGTGPTEVFDGMDGFFGGVKLI
jgi:spore maturation protein SpmB